MTKIVLVSRLKATRSHYVTNANLSSLQEVLNLGLDYCFRLVMDEKWPSSQSDRWGTRKKSVWGLLQIQISSTQKAVIDSVLAHLCSETALFAFTTAHKLTREHMCQSSVLTEARQESCLQKWLWELNGTHFYWAINQMFRGVRLSNRSLSTGFVHSETDLFCLISLTRWYSLSFLMPIKWISLISFGQMGF